ncbi:MAG: GntR family transcriptional regulator [Acidimicrobiia bacterium]
MALPIEIDKENGIPVYVQLEERIRLLIREGILKEGDPLPTVRSLAVDLGINANTVARVYRDLGASQFLRLERGKGTFVDEAAGGPMPKHDFEVLEQKAIGLISSAKDAHMTPKELCQFIETRWTKEASHDSR